MQLQRRIQPNHPTIQQGWHEGRTPWGSIFYGLFVLSKGETVDNSEIGVKVDDVMPSRCKSAFAEFPDRAQVVLQFFNPSNHQVLCQVILVENSNSSINLPDMCGDKVGIAVVGVMDINTDEKWAVFDLR